MAINAKKVEIVESNFNNYIGVGLFEVLAINPTRAQLTQLFPNSTSTDEINYLSEDKNGTKVFRLDVYCKLVEHETIPNFIHKVSFFLRNEKPLNTSGDKIKVINKYGMTMYIPLENFNEGTVPENLAWFPLPYKVCYPGQEELINFLKAYFATKSLNKLVNGIPVQIETPSEAEMSIDNMEALLNGNIAELKPIIEVKNLVKLVIGVRTTDDNKVYQDTFMQGFVKANTKKYDYLQKHIEQAKNAGRYPRTEFSLGDLTICNNNVEKSINNSPIPSYTGETIQNVEEGDLPF